MTSTCLMLINSEPRVLLALFANTWTTALGLKDFQNIYSVLLRFDTTKLEKKEVHDVQYVACMNNTAGSFTIDGNFLFA